MKILGFTYVHVQFLIYRTESDCVYVCVHVKTR